MENSDVKPHINRTGKVCSHYARYGISCDEYDDLRMRAAGCCEICGANEQDVPRKKLFVDHYEDDETIHIRGLLCTRCNWVMAAWDGNRSWGESIRWKDAAGRYAANSWEQPRRKRDPRVPVSGVLVRAVAFSTPGDLAERLRESLTAEELAALEALLKESATDTESAA
jgi:hypothetical protein